MKSCQGRMNYLFLSVRSIELCWCIKMLVESDINVFVLYYSNSYVFSNSGYLILFYLVSGYAFNVLLDPILIFYLKLGLKGAAMAHVISQ